MSYKRKIVSFRVEPELFARMTEVALAEDRTVGSWLRRLVEDELNKKTNKRKISGEEKNE